MYDGLGRREKKTVNSNLTEFLFDGVNPAQETNGAMVLANILTGLRMDEFVTRNDVGAGTTSSLLTDPLGSVLALADSAGAVQTEYTYEPFGKTTTTGISSTNPFQFTSRENDGTDVYYYRARYFHPGLQRFISEDPRNFNGGDFNLFSYVRNSPTKYQDPTGEVPTINCPNTGSGCDDTYTPSNNTAELTTGVSVNAWATILSHSTLDVAFVMRTNRDGAMTPPMQRALSLANRCMVIPTLQSYFVV